MGGAYLVSFRVLAQKKHGNADLTELVRYRIANPWSEETLREFEPLSLRHCPPFTGGERYLSSLDCVIADLVITLKRGIFTRGYYVSANNIKDCERPSYLILPFG